MIIRLNRLVLCLLLITALGACRTEDEVVNQSALVENELSFVATIGKSSSRTIYQEEPDAGNNNRPYLKALWGGEKETEEIITLYDADGISCDFSASIPEGGEQYAKFIGFPKGENFIPVKAYYNKGKSVSTLTGTLDLTTQEQGASASIAHISGQDFMVGTVTLPSEDSNESGSIDFDHLTGVVKYTLDFSEETPEPLQLELLSLKQVEGEPVLLLQKSFDGQSVLKRFSNLDLTFKENNGLVNVTEDNVLEAYVSVFPSQTNNVKFTLFARATTGLYEAGAFKMNQDLEAGKLYTIATDMKRLTEYDWYFNPEVLKDSNGKDSLVYKIGNADELEALAKIVNGDAGLKEADDFKDKTIEMTEDVDLEEKQPWTPIGDSKGNAFSGKFNGGGNAISNMQCSGDGAQGLFGCLGGATIQNLTVNGDVSGSGDYTGGVAGYAQNSSFENVSMNGNVSGEGDYTGGLVGYTENCTI